MSLLHTTPLSIEQIIQLAAQEDMPNQDITTNALLTTHNQAKFNLIAKQSTTLCGQQIFAKTVQHFDKNSKIQWLYSDGDNLDKNTKIARITGDMNKILQSERIALNLIQYLSGIANSTKKCVQTVQNAAQGIKVPKIFDTRKTLPLYRDLAKFAVTTGGGFNHRRDLSSDILIKDNHLSAFNTVEDAVITAKRYVKKSNLSCLIIVECENEVEVRSAIKAQPDVIILDNMTPNMIESLVHIVPKNILTEASGNITMQNIAEYAGTGVDRISLGFLTHTVASSDFSLGIDEVL